jgi:biotin-(acetyl-CoA carboxylase) ligase
MKRPDKRPREGILREDAGTADKEGFIAPSIGMLEHALYFTAAPSVTDKAKQVIEKGRLALPGVVVVWDETVGRRKGGKAVPKSWWAEAGSLTAAFVFPTHEKLSQHEKLSRAAAAVIRVINSFRPRAKVTFVQPNDLCFGDKKLGAVFAESFENTNLAVVRLNCSNDLAKAPTAIASSACRLIDFIEVEQLPLQKAGTLPNTLLTRLMTEIPKEFARGK